MAPTAPLEELVRTRRWLIGAAGVGALTGTGVSAQRGGLKGHQTPPETSDSERYRSPVFGIEVEFTSPWQEKGRTADDNAERHSVESILLRTEWAEGTLTISAIGPDWFYSPLEGVLDFQEESTRTLVNAPVLLERTDTSLTMLRPLHESGDAFLIEEVIWEPGDAFATSIKFHASFEEFIDLFESFQQTVRVGGEAPVRGVRDRRIISIVRNYGS